MMTRLSRAQAKETTLDYEVAGYARRRGLEGGDIVLPDVAGPDLGSGIDHQKTERAVDALVKQVFAGAGRDSAKPVQVVPELDPIDQALKALPKSSGLGFGLVTAGDVDRMRGMLLEAAKAHRAGGSDWQDGGRRMRGMSEPARELVKALAGLEPVEQKAAILKMTPGQVMGMREGMELGLSRGGRGR
jgi:hypothetical protein